MIRVLHSVSNMDRAGIETMLMNYYRNMDREQIQFDFLCNKKKPGAYDQEILALGGRIYRTPGLNPFKYPEYLKFMQTLFQENPDYRIVEAHNGALGVYALYAAKKNKIPVRIFHAHGASISRDWKLPLKLVCKALLPLNMNHHFSCGTAAAACYFPRKTVAGEDYVLVPNAIELSKFRYDDLLRQRIRREYGLEEKHIVGHVGRFSPQKNHVFLLEVFSQLRTIDPMAHLVLIGEGGLQEKMKQKVKAMGLENAVSFLGNISNVNEWYQAFDVFVLPSIWEGLPVVGVEAQTADLPCIFADTVTAEIGILEKTRFLDLKEGCDRWAQAVQVALQNKERTDVSAVIARHGYDISVESRKLQARYLKLAGVQCEDRNSNTPLRQ